MLLIERKAHMFSLRKDEIMNLIRRNTSPVSSYRPGSIDDQFGRMIENMFEEFMAPFTPFSALSPMSAEGATSPRVNLVERDDAFEVEAELPGVKKEDIKVSIDNRRITIEGEAKRESEQKEGENVVYAERSTRKFARSFTLPTDVDDASAQAKLENGILVLTLPKKEPAQAKKLTVQ
jgi:HSP20 family protein